MNRTGQFILTNQTHKYRYLTFKETSLPLTFTVQNRGTKLQINYSESYYNVSSPLSLGDCGSNGLFTNRRAGSHLHHVTSLMKRLEEPSIIYEKETVSDLFSEVLPLWEKLVECLLKNQLKN